MSGLLVPDDWDEMTDGFYKMTMDVPNSPYWRANIKGQIQRLTLPKEWDAETGDVDQAVAISQDIFDSLKGDTMLQWVVYLSGNQTVPGGGNDVLYELDTVEYDPFGQFDLVNYEWVVPQTSLYIIGAFVQYWNMSGTSDLWARIRAQVNGVYRLTSGNFFASDLNFVHAEFEKPCYLAQGDVVNFWTAHSNSVARDTADYNQTQRAWCYKL